MNFNRRNCLEKLQRLNKEELEEVKRVAVKASELLNRDFAADKNPEAFYKARQLTLADQLWLIETCDKIQTT